MSFFELAAEKKTSFFGATRKIFGPSYFVTALPELHINISLKVP